MRHRFGRTLAAAVVVIAVGGVAAADDPPVAVDTKAIDKAVVASLRDVHNYGADLYNVSRDYTGAYRVYEGALRTVKPLLAHRPDLQKAIDDGLAAASSDSEPSRRAFRLHETIEDVRGVLKGTPKKPVEPLPEKKPTEKSPEPKKPVDKTPETKKPVDKTPETKKPADKAPETKKPTDSTPPPKPKEPPETAPAPKTPPVKGDGASASGMVTLDSNAVSEGEISFVSLDQKTPKVVTAKIKDGSYSVKDLPPGKYKVTVVGGKDVMIPAKYKTTDTSGLEVELKAGANNLDLDLK